MRILGIDCLVSISSQRLSQQTRSYFLLQTVFQLASSETRSKSINLYILLISFDWNAQETHVIMGLERLAICALRGLRWPVLFAWILMFVHISGLTTPHMLYSYPWHYLALA